MGLKEDEGRKRPVVLHSEFVQETERTKVTKPSNVGKRKRPVVPFQKAREIYKLGIDMEDEKSAKVMFVMKSEMKQFKVDKENLLSVLQLLMNTLIDLETDEQRQ